MASMLRPLCAGRQALLAGLALPSTPLALGALGAALAAPGSSPVWSRWGANNNVDRKIGGSRAATTSAPPVAREGEDAASGEAETEAPSSSAASSSKQYDDTIDFGFQRVPVGDKEKLVKGVFSSVAGSYDVMNDLMSAGMHRLWKDHFVAKLNPFPGMSHLDVAGGTGDIGFRVQDAIEAAELAASARSAALSTPPGDVTITDINPEMLAEGQKKAKTTGRDMRANKLHFQVGDATKLDWVPDASKDAYTIAFGIRNVTHRDVALKEAYRILKPGGVFMCLEFSQVVIPGLREFYDTYSFHVIPEIGRLVANDAESYRYLVESIREFPDQETFAHMIREAGFKSVRYENLSGGIVAIHTGFKV